MHRSFTSFLSVLEAAGELRRVSVPVATELEITAWADREMKSPGGGKALLFERPTVGGQVSRFPVAINTMGSHRRMALALGLEDVGELARKMELLLKAKPPTNLRSAWNLALQGLGLLHARPTHLTGDAPCQEVVHLTGDPTPSLPVSPSPPLPVSPSLLPASPLPILNCWPHDGGRFITLPCVHTRDPDTGERNVGMYRMQIYDDRTTGMHWQVHKVGARHGKRYYETRRRACPSPSPSAAIPRYTFAATAPLPDGLDEFLFAGYLRKKSVELVKCETNDLEVPADADFVLEGYVHPASRRAPKARSATTPASTRCPSRLSRLPPHRDHAPQRRRLSLHHRRHPADGRFLHGQRSVRDSSCPSSR